MGKQERKKAYKDMINQINNTSSGMNKSTFMADELAELEKQIKEENDSKGIREAKALAQTKNPKAIEQLMKLLSNTETIPDNEWIESMNEFGTDANPRLIKYLEDETNWQTNFPEPDFESESYDEYVMEMLNKQNGITNVISVLAGNKDENSVEPLIKCLKKRGEVDVTKEAALALGKIGDKRAVKPLLSKIEKYEIGDSRLDPIAAALTLLGEKIGIPLLVKSSVINPDYFEYNHILQEEPEMVGKELEKLELYQKAEKIYTENGMLEKAAEMRKKKAEQGAVKVDQTVVQGNQITNTEIKDSVVNRSNVGGGGSSKAEELREAKALLDDGIIDEDEFKQMKKEILGK